MNQAPIKVLVIDDDDAYVGVIQHSLHPFQNYTFEVHWEREEEKALLRLVTDSSINVILMDYFLQNNNGVVLTKKIRDAKIETPVIFLTSNNDYHAAIEALKHGGEDYLLKEEIKDNLLARTILSCLDKIKLKKQVAHAQKEKLLATKKAEAIKELVVTMCHEFNNPLAAIKISTTILAKQKNTDKEKELLNKLNNGASELEAEITKLRELNIDTDL
jgi:DNA-binding NarL/FixJ family response regulator